VWISLWCGSDSLGRTVPPVDNNIRLFFWLEIVKSVEMQLLGLYIVHRQKPPKSCYYFILELFHSLTATEHKLT